VARQLPRLPTENILIEPSPRESAPAIGLAAALIAARDPDAVMGSFAADHHIVRAEVFAEAVREAIDVARQGYLVTIGLEPTRPETGYGYIHRGSRLERGAGFSVSEFTEKPSLDRAQRFVDSGEYLWNASMFAWRASVLLDEIARFAPELHRGLLAIAEAWDGPERDDVVARVWPTLPKIAIDYAVMEGAAAAGRVVTIPADLGWHDIGDWHAVGEVVAPDAHGNSILGSARTYLDGASDCVIAGHSGRMVAVVGLNDVVVVDTDDAVLVCARSHAQDVKRIVAELDADDPLR
jgi:mannose-1-phosphate guanylyltransferase